MKKFQQRSKLFTMYTAEELHAAVESAGFSVSLLEDTSKHTQFAYAMLTQAACDQNALSPDGSSLSDGYRITAELFARGELKSVLLLAALGNGHGQNGKRKACSI